MNDLIPFGKYKGQPIEVLRNDKEYLNWLLAQNWVSERFGNIYQTIINNFQEPDETPEHNSFQAKFLNKKYVSNFMSIIFGMEINDEYFNGCQDFSKKTVNGFEVLFETKISCFSEKSAYVYDVVITPIFKYESCTKEEYEKGEKKYINKACIELKPSIGDDYPAIMRKLPNESTLITKKYTGIGASFEQVKEIMQTKNIKLILENEYAEE